MEKKELFSVSAKRMSRSIKGEREKLTAKPGFIESRIRGAA